MHSISISLALLITVLLVLLISHWLQISNNLTNFVRIKSSASASAICIKLFGQRIWLWLVSLSVMTSQSDSVPNLEDDLEKFSFFFLNPNSKCVSVAHWNFDKTRVARVNFFKVQYLVAHAYVWNINKMTGRGRGRGRGSQPLGPPTGPPRGPPPSRPPRPQATSTPLHSSVNYYYKIFAPVRLESLISNFRVRAAKLCRCQLYPLRPLFRRLPLSLPLLRLLPLKQWKSWILLRNLLSFSEEKPAKASM